MAYTIPTAADLRTRYPAFASVPDETVEYWITDAQRFVKTNWNEGDYGPGILAYAAHQMARNGALFGSGASIPGVTQFKSGTFSAQFSDEAVKASVKGGYGSTQYGIEFAEMLARNVGPGVRTIRTLPIAGAGWPA